MGVLFVKMWKMGRCFCKKKWEMGGVKKWKIGGVLYKRGPFLNAGCIMYSIGIFYFTFYLFGGGAYAPNAPPCLRA